MKIKEAINRIIWKHRDSLEEFLIVIIDRMTTTGYRYIPFSCIKNADNNYIYVSNEVNEFIAIPIHRVIRIEKKNGEIVWKR
ncbi:MAG: RNA repair domain-containing protein [Ignisphaera sp.]|uniref:DUF504 domain-containing protein n=1 Tax=Ignisphaera aggregans TaxID=334771 RepID=A0A7J3MZB5_9CREN